MKMTIIIIVHLQINQIRRATKSILFYLADPVWSEASSRRREAKKKTSVCTSFETSTPSISWIQHIFLNWPLPWHVLFVKLGFHGNERTHIPGSVVTKFPSVPSSILGLVSCAGWGKVASLFCSRGVFCRDSILFSPLTKNPSFLRFVVPFDFIPVGQDNCAQLDTLDT